MRDLRHRLRNLIVSVPVPVLLGISGLGIRLGRTLDATQVTRDTAHMDALGTDFSLPGTQAIARSLGRDFVRHAAGSYPDAQGNISSLNYCSHTALLATGFDSLLALLAASRRIWSKDIFSCRRSTCRISDRPEEGGSAQGLYVKDTPTPVGGDLTVIADKQNCYFASNQTHVKQDVQYAPTSDHWGNSRTATGYKSVTYSGSGLSLATSTNVDNFSTKAADHAVRRVRRGDPDPDQGNRSLTGVVIFTIGLGSNG